MARRNYGLTQPLARPEAALAVSSSAAPEFSTSRNRRFNEEADANDTPAILMLNGWSPGPLLYLRRLLQDEYPSIPLLQPKLSMPPFSGWFHPRIALGAILWLLYLGAGRWLCLESSWSHHRPTQGLLVVLFSVIMVIGIRVSTSEVVQLAMHVNVNRCRKLLAEHRVVLIVGFSWGGAVGSELVAQGYVPGVLEPLLGNEDDGISMTTHSPQGPLCLFLAPTTSVVSKLSLRKPYCVDAAVRIVGALHQRKRPSPGIRVEPVVEVVHAYGDSGFCPHPEEWDASGDSGESRAAAFVRLQMVEDVHVFSRPSSRREIIALFQQLLARAIPATS